MWTIAAAAAAAALAEYERTGAIYVPPPAPREEPGVDPCLLAFGALALGVLL